jgi:hypothetical protein
MLSLRRLRAWIRALVDGVPHHPELVGDVVRLEPAQVAELAHAPLALGQLREPLRILVLELAEAALVASRVEVVEDGTSVGRPWKCSWIVQSTTFVHDDPYRTPCRFPA